MPISVNTSRRRMSTSFSNLKAGMPKVSKPPISGARSYTVTATPLRISTSAQPKPAGPAPITATRLASASNGTTLGRQPWANAVSVMYFSTLPMVTAPNSSFKVQAPSHKRSCGQTRPHTSGKLLVACANSAASMMRPS